MTSRRYALKQDESQADIVSGLRKCGYTVLIIGQPVDLLVGLHHELGTSWRLVEVKKPTKSGKVRKRTDQPEQTAFIKEHNVPVVTTIEDALKALGRLG